MQFSYSQAQEPWILENNEINPYRLLESYDGGLVFVGAGTNSSETGKIIKYDASGTKLWEHTFEENDETILTIAVIEDINGDLIVGGLTTQYDSLHGDGFLMRIDACGNLLWFKNLGEEDTYDLVQHLVLGDNNSVYFNHYISGSNDDRYTLKHVDVDGNTLWQERYFIGLGGAVKGLVKTQDKGFLMIGTIYIQPFFSQESSTTYLRSAVVRTDSLGNELWTNIYRWEEDVPECIQISSNGSANQIDSNHYNIVGLNKSDEIYQPIMYELNNDGGLLWHKDFSNTNLNYVVANSQLFEDTLLMVLTCYPIATDPNSGHFKVLKTNLLGEVVDEYIDENISYFIRDFKLSNDSTSAYILTDGGGLNMSRLYALKFNPSTMELDTFLTEDVNDYDYYCPEGVEELNYYFPDLSVEDVFVKEKKQLRLAPNPAKNYTYVYFDIANFNRSAKIEIHNLQGKLVNSYPLQGAIGRVYEDLSSYTSGIYVVSLIMDNRLLESSKLVVE